MRRSVTIPAPIAALTLESSPRFGSGQHEVAVLQPGSWSASAAPGSGTSSAAKGASYCYDSLDSGTTCSTVAAVSVVDWATAVPVNTDLAGAALITVQRATCTAHTCGGLLHTARGGIAARMPRGRGANAPRLSAAAPGQPFPPSCLSLTPGTHP